MKLQTQISIPEGGPKIDYSSKMFLLGSCFSENMGGKLQYYKFQSLQNPFGILFHPFAIENFLKRASLQQHYQKEEVFENNEIWSCFEAHSRLNALSKTEILEKLNSALAESHQFLKEATHVIITLGTSWTYKHIEAKKYVANCHKLPQKNFKKELASVSAIQESIANSVRYIQQLNPNLHFIFTVSPVRHLKDGFVENQQSKAHLITALHECLKALQNAKNLPSPLGKEKVSGDYFPSYEIMMDELRDYRFYTEDLIHPNEIAIQYIWQRFVETWVEKDASLVMKEVESIQQALQHKPFNPKSVAHQKFLRQLKEKQAQLQEQYPFMMF